MSTQENGIPSQVTFFPSVNITSSTNATPIVVSTAPNPHNLTSGDKLRISGHAVNTNANGIFDASVLTPTTVALFQGGAPVAGNGAGVATGVLQPLSLGATFQAPADGDDETAASVDVAFDALADRTAFLCALASGSFKVAGRFQTTVSIDRNANCYATWDGFTPPITAGTDTFFDLAGATVWQFTTFVAQTSDVIIAEVDLNTGFTNGAGATLPVNLSLWLSDVAVGAGDNFQLVPGSGRVAPVRGNSAAFAESLGFFRLSGAWSVVNAGTNPKLKVRANTTQTTINAAGAALNLIGDLSVRALLLRPTGVPQ